MLCWACDFVAEHWLFVLTAAIAFYTFVLRTSYRMKPTRPPVNPERTKHSQRGTGDTIPCTNPATGEPLTEGEARRCYTEDDVQRCLGNAREAQRDWAKTTWKERRAFLMDLLDWIVDNQDTLINWSVWESGKTITEAAAGEVMITCEKIRWIVSHGEKCLDKEGRPVASMLLNKKAWVEYHPLGAIGIIVPWNYPVHNVISAVVAAVFSGNAAICKVSEATSWSAPLLEDVFRTLLAARGHNPDLVQVITGFAETGKALVNSGVDKILFIGSPQVGKLVMKAASDTLTPVILELGGKDPFIIFDDADLDHVVDIAVRAAFINCGQNCIAAERFYVQEGIHDEFVKRVLAVMERTAQGASDLKKDMRYDFGAITFPPQVKIIDGLVQDAVKSGADIRFGGKKAKSRGSKASGPEEKEEKENKDATFFSPTVLTGVTRDMRIHNEETFGPVMSIITFKQEDDLLDMVNSTVYGLGSSVFTTNSAKAERVGSQIVTGMVNINDFAMVPMIQSLPFGGVRHSGFGAFNGKEGLRGFSRRTAVTRDRFFPLRIAPPAFLQYPVANNAHRIVQQGVRMVYGQSLWGSAVALFRMLREMMKSKK